MSNIESANQGRIPLRRQLRWRLAATFVLLTLVVITIVTTFTVAQLRNQSTRQTLLQLESVVDLKQNQINRWLETGDILLHTVIADPSTQNRILNVLTFEATLPTVQESLNNSLKAGVNAQNEVDEQAYQRSFNELFIYNLDGRILLASDPTLLNRIVTLQPYFQPSIEHEYVTAPYYDVGTNDLTAYITHPIYAINGDIVGVIAGRFNMELLREITSERVGLGNTGETYLISNENNYFLTPSRFEGFSPTRAYHSQGIDQVLTGTDGTGEYDNYGNTPVYGVYRWIPQLNAGLIAEISQSEAQEAVSQTTVIIVALAGFLAVVAGLAGLYFATTIARPVVKLTQIAADIAAGNFQQRVQVQSKDEIGELGTSFNQMSSQLEDLVNTLEDRVNNRTRELRTVAEVSKSAAVILNPDDLIQQVVDLTKESFNLYHAHIYLLDNTSENLALAAGAGEAGRAMKAKGHSIPYSRQQSLVARAARTRKGVIINNVTQEPGFLPNALLPETKSEMAVPMVVGNELVGVLDVQSTEVNRFGDEDVRVQSALADQIAVAVRNALSFKLIEDAQSRDQALAQIVGGLTNATSESDILAVIANYASRYNPRSVSLSYIDSDANSNPVTLTNVASWRNGEMWMDSPTLNQTFPLRMFPLTQLWIDSPTSPLFISDTHTDDRIAESLLATLDQLNNRALVTIPLFASGRWQGVISMSWEEPHNFSQQEHTIYGALTQSAASVVASRRAFLEAENSRREAEMLYQISKIINDSQSEQDLIDAVVTFRPDEAISAVSLTLFENNDYDTAIYSRVAADWRRDGNRRSGVVIPIVEFPFIRMLNRHEMIMSADVVKDSGLDETSRNTFLAVNIKSFVFSPLVIGERWLGSLAFFYDQPHIHTEEEQRFLRSITEQMTSAAERMSLARQTEKRAAEIQTVAEVGARMVTNLEYGSLLWSIANLTKESFNRYHVNIYLIDEQGENLDLVAASGDVGQTLVSRGHHIALNRPNSLVAGTARTRKTVVVNNVTAEPGYLPNDLLPETKSEMTTPIVFGDRLIGVLDIQDKVLNAFDETSIQSKSVLANQIAVAIENASSFAQVQLFADTVNNSPIAINVWRLENVNDTSSLRLTMANPATEALTQIKPETIVGKRIFEIYPTLAESELPEIYANVVRTGQTVELGELDFTTDPSAPNILAVKAFPLPNSSVGISFENVTARKQQEQERSLVFDIVSKLTNAHNEPEIMDAMSEYATLRNADSASLLLLENVDGGLPIWATLAARWQSGNNPVQTTLGTRFYLPEFAISRLWFTDPFNPVLLGNLNTDPRADEMTRKTYAVARIEAAAMMPLYTQGRWIGVIMFSWNHPVTFNDLDQRILATVMRQTTPTIDALLSARQTEASRKEAETLYQISEAINATTNANEITEAIFKYSGIDSFAVTLGVWDTFDLTSARQFHTVGISSNHMDQMVQSVGESLPIEYFPMAYEQAKTGLTVVTDVEDRNQIDEITAESLKQLGYKAYMSVIPKLAGKAMGALTFTSEKPKQFTQSEIRIATNIAGLVAAALERDLLQQQTARRAAELQTVAEVSATTTTELDLDILLQSVVDVTKERFNLYHAHIYLMDDAGDNLVLAAGAGEPGRIMKSEGRSIPLNRTNSLVARAAREQQGVISNDVIREIDFLPNPLLPNTRSEMSVPMVVGDRLVGVLDVQSDQINRFTPEDVRVQTTLGDQVAVAVQNARQFSATRRRLGNVQTSNEIAEFLRADTEPLETIVENTLRAISNTLGATGAVMSLYDAEAAAWRGFAAVSPSVTTQEFKAVVVPENLYPHGLAALRKQDVVAINDSRLYPDMPPEYAELDDLKSVITIPIITSHQLNGVVFITYNTKHTFTAEEIELARTLSAQISIGVDRYLAEQEVQLYIDVVNNTPTGLYVWQLEEPERSESLRLKIANPSTLSATGVSPSDIMGLLMKDAFPGLMETEIPQIYADVARGNETVDLGEITYGDNRMDENIFAVKAFSLPNNSMGVSFENITARKLQEEEQQLLYGISSQLTNARNEEDVINALAVYGSQRGAASGLLLTIENEDGVPIWTEITALWNQGQASAIPVGTRFYLPEFPISKLWLSNPTKAILISDIKNDSRVDAATQAVYGQSGTRSVVIMPLFVQGRWLGLVTFTWREIIQFNDQDDRIINAAMLQATSTVDALISSALTRKRAAELQTVAEVSKAAAATLNADELLLNVTELTKSSFDLYHAHIYLMDENNRNLVLAAGAGDAGQMMKERGHRIRIDQPTSLVANAARSGESVIINDVTQVPNFLPNPLLPETRSEMSIPMIVNDRLIGVMDVQDTAVNRFTQTDALVMRTLADQIAVAVENARAFQFQQETAERLREVDRLKSQFLANMSHELRTPLNSIIGYAEVLLDGIDGELNDEATEDVQAIHGGGKHLLTIINDILDLAKIEAGQMFMDRREADTVAVIEDVINTVKILAINKGIELNLEKSEGVPTIYADPIRIKQIVLNLVNNSIKFTEKGSVTVEVYRENEQTLGVRVKDTGIGMTETDLGGLFQQFHQVDGSATRRAGGTGLGLVITRHLVHMHEGEIGVTSEKGKGSTFWFTMPIFAEYVAQKA